MRGLLAAGPHYLRHEEKTEVGEKGEVQDKCECRVTYTHTHTHTHTHAHYQRRFVVAVVQERWRAREPRETLLVIAAVVAGEEELISAPVAAE